MDDNRKFFLSIETNENNKKMKSSDVKLVKEVNVGTDDFDLAGGDFARTFGNYSRFEPKNFRFPVPSHTTALQWPPT